MKSGPRDLVARNIATIALTRMVKKGSLVRVARGLYALPDHQASEYASFGEVSAKYPPLRPVRFSAAALTEGVETHFINGVPVALEALREAWREQKMTMNDLWHLAKVNRVTNSIRPYLESLT